MIDWPITVDASKARQYAGASHITVSRPRCARRSLAWPLDLPGLQRVARFCLWKQQRCLVPMSSSILTGQLGDVMRESARIALSYVESHLEAGSVEGERVGARSTSMFRQALCPKMGLRRSDDGDCARLTAHATACRSDDGNDGRGYAPGAGTDRRPETEGVGSRRAGLKRVIVPKPVEVDLDEIPEAVRNDMEFILVDDISRVLHHAQSAMLLLPTRRQRRSRWKSPRFPSLLWVSIRADRIGKRGLLSIDSGPLRCVTYG